MHGSFTSQITNLRRGQFERWLDTVRFMVQSLDAAIKCPSFESKGKHKSNLNIVSLVHQHQTPIFIYRMWPGSPQTRLCVRFDARYG